MARSDSLVKRVATVGTLMLSKSRLVDQSHDPVLHPLHPLHGRLHPIARVATRLEAVAVPRGNVELFVHVFMIFHVN